MEIYVSIFMGSFHFGEIMPVCGEIVMFMWIC